MVVIGSAKCTEAACHTADLNNVGMTKERKLDRCHRKKVKHISAWEYSVVHIVGIVENVRSRRIEFVMGTGHVVASVAGIKRCKRSYHCAVFVKRNLHFLR